MRNVAHCDPSVDSSSNVISYQTEEQSFVVKENFSKVFLYDLYITYVTFLKLNYGQLHIWLYIRGLTVIYQQTHFSP